MQTASRLTIAVSAAAAFLLVGIGLAGMVVATDEVELTTLSLPGPRAGDEARYEYIQTTGGLVEPTIVDGPRDGFGFAFRSPRVAYDVYGEPHLTNSFYAISWGFQEGYDENNQPSGEQEWMQYADWTFDIDVEDGQVISYWIDEASHTEDAGDGYVWTHSYGYTSFNDRYGEEPLHIYDYPCLTFNVFQDASVPVVGEMDLMEGTPCKWLRKEATIGAFGSYIPIGIETFDDIEAVHFASTTPFVPYESMDRITRPAHGGSHVWLSEDFPYPVKIAHPLDAEGDRYDVYVLTEFFRGDEPLATKEDDFDRSATLEIDEVPVLPWGVDASSITEGFTSEDAWNAALADPDLGLQEFLDEHPDAYTGQLYHTVYEEENRGGDDAVTTQYQIVVTAGGTTYLPFYVRQDIVTGHDAFGEHEEPVTTVRVEKADHQTEPFPDPEDVPDKMPSVASVADLWRRTGGHDLQENTYRFGIWCGDGCDKVSYMVSAGYSDEWRRQAYEPDTVEQTFGAEGETSESYMDSDMIDVRFFGGRMDIATSNYRMELRKAESEQAVEAEDSVPVLSKSAVRADSIWEFPPAAAVAGIGAGSLLFGSAIAGWPALKGGILAPLFSRVHRSQALEHPLRRRLMDLVNDNPGIHLQAIVDLVDEPRSTVLHHMRTLERTDLVVAEHTGHYTCYFSKDRAARLSMKAAPAVKAQGAKDLLGVIAGSPGLSVKDAAAKAGLSLSTTYYHVRRLRDAGLVDMEEGEHGAGLSITSTGNATLQELIPAAS